MIAEIKQKTAFGNPLLEGIVVIDFFIRIQSSKAAQRFVEKHPYLEHLNNPEKKDLQKSFIETLNKPEFICIKKRSQHIHIIPFGNGFDEPVKDPEVMKAELFTILDETFRSILSATPVHIDLSYLFLITDTASRKGLWMLNYLIKQPHRITVYI